MTATTQHSDAWLRVARRYEGTREIKGVKHSPTIVRWLIELGAWWRDDEQPWCGVFTGAVLKEAGHAVPKACYRARAWLQWGLPLKTPALGCIVVFERDGGGHVGFVVGQASSGNLLVLGGNQGDEVNIRAFSPNRVLGYRWPVGAPLPRIEALPLMATNVGVSTNEA